MTRPIDEVLSRLQNVKRFTWGWTARCPAHDDQRNSLSLKVGDDERVLLKCHANPPCQFSQIADAIDLPVSSFFSPQPFNTTRNKKSGPQPKVEIVTIYDYHDATGQLLYQVCRTPDKQFPQRRPDGKGDWIWGMGDVEPVLYRLPQLLAAIQKGHTIFIVEGEKDVDRLVSQGLTATTSPMGAGKWKPTYNAHLQGANVVIIPDNDEPGEKHARSVALSLQGKAQTVKVVLLPYLPPKGDVSDFLDQGGTLEGLKALIDQTPLFTPSDLLDRSVAVQEEDEDLKPGSWSDLDDLDNTQWLWPGWLAIGFQTMIGGVSGCNKSALVLRLAQSVIQGKDWPDGTPYTGTTGKVVWCEGESGQAINKKRLKDWGIPKEAILTPINAKMEICWEDPIHRSKIEQQSALPEVQLIVVDSLSGVYGGDENESKFGKVTKWFAALAKSLQKTVVMVHHARKSENAETNITKADLRGHGSIIQHCRVIGGIDAPDPADSTQKRLKALKNNLGLLADPIGFYWENDQLVFGEAPNTPRKETVIDRAKDLLRALLQHNPKPASEIIEALEGEGISKNSAYKAKDALRLVVVKDGKRSLWSLPRNINH